MTTQFLAAVVPVAKIAAKAELEAEAKAAAPAEERRRAEAEERCIAESRKKNGKTPATSAAPDAKAQRSFTNADSRILLTKDGYIQGYNAKAAVDARARLSSRTGSPPA